MKRTLKLHLNCSHQTKLRESRLDLKPLMCYKEQIEEFSFSWRTFLDIQHLMSDRHNKVEDTFSASPAFAFASTHEYSLISKLCDSISTRLVPLCGMLSFHLNTISETYSNVSNWSMMMPGVVIISKYHHSTLWYWLQARYLSSVCISESCKDLNLPVVFMPSTADFIKFFMNLRAPPHKSV